MADDSIKVTKEILNKGDELELLINDNDLIKKIKHTFRHLGARFALESDFVKHAFLKPHGYAGDFNIIETVYDNNVTSPGLGYCVDKIFQQDGYARAVRSRKELMKKYLVDFIKKPGTSDLNILNIACGSCREIREMFKEFIFDSEKKVNFTMIDQDKDALNFSKDHLSGSSDIAAYNFLAHSVYDYVKDPDKYREILEGQDLVYSIGLADYLPDDALKSLIRFAYSLLKPGGRLVFAHKDSKNYKPLAPDWWCDWTFYLRNEPEVVDLVQNSGISNFSIKTERENATNIIFFLDIEKK